MKELSFEIISPHSAGIDVGSRFHMVAAGQTAQDVKKFGVFTDDHNQMIRWLTQRGITSIAMESTGNYWQTLFDALQGAGFEVELVNGNQIKNVKGKKTDVQDCMWIQKLHSLGLLTGSFLPQADLQKLRTYYNHRQHLINQAARYVNKMQKAMRLMNIRLEVVLNDVTGKSGRAIIEAMLGGERNPVTLASLADYRVKTPKEEIARALEGNWREDLLFELRECLSFYDFYSAKIKECDDHLAVQIARLPKAKSAALTVPAKRKTASKFSPGFDVEKLAQDYFGVNLFQIGGVSHNTVLCLLTHMGRDIHKFSSAKHFASWLRLSPNNKISGGKVLSSRTPKGKNKIALALRQAANSAGNQKNHPMTPFFRRIAHKKGREAAVTATARKLAVTIWRMITHRENYIPFDYEKQRQESRIKQISRLKHKLHSLNLEDDELRSMFKNLSFSAT